MKKGLIAGAFLLGLTSFTAQAQSTASGVSNTGTPKAGSTSAQDGAVGNTVSAKKGSSGSMNNPRPGSMNGTKSGSMSETGSKTSGQKMKSTSKSTKSSSHTSGGR